MTPALLNEVVKHAVDADGREVCGLFVWDNMHNAEYHKCQNMAVGNDEFVLSAYDWVQAESRGLIIGIVHTHNGDVTPSVVDRNMCNRSGVPWWIVNVKGEWTRIVPDDWSPIGRPFAWGIQDCLSLFRDVARVEKDFLRWNEFWDTQDLFMENLAKAGFVTVNEDPINGDGLLLSIRGSGKVNHCGIYVGDGKILHHLPGRLARIDDLGVLHYAVKHVIRRAA